MRGGVYGAGSVHRLVGYAKLELYVAGLSVDRAARMAAAAEVVARGVCMAHRVCRSGSGVTLMR